MRNEECLEGKIACEKLTKTSHGTQPCEIPVFQKFRISASSKFRGKNSPPISACQQPPPECIDFTAAYCTHFLDVSASPA
jgi:hypothetical protein